MKKFTLIDIITMLGIAASILLVLMFASGCSMKFYKTPKDVRQCCERVNAHADEMKKFVRYCKVAVFLANSENATAVGPGVKKAARQAVDVCKFVFRVESDKDLIAAGDAQEYYKVRSYIIKDPAQDPFWRRSLPCDPLQVTCEEF
tara:strand:+ start:316 stop:753 length:438 start_codon:yes stop_codon:yes gene_type:complete